MIFLMSTQGIKKRGVRINCSESVLVRLSYTAKYVHAIETESWPSVGKNESSAIV